MALEYDRYWLRFELLWRDYFVCIARKYGNDFFKLGGIQASLNPGKYAEEWKDAREELRRGEGSELGKWMEGRTGVP